jgi:hypothetical protein
MRADGSMPRRFIEGEGELQNAPAKDGKHASVGRNAGGAP